MTQWPWMQKFGMGLGVAALAAGGSDVGPGIVELEVPAGADFRTLARAAAERALARGRKGVLVTRRAAGPQPIAVARPARRRLNAGEVEALVEDTRRRLRLVQARTGGGRP